MRFWRWLASGRFRAGVAGSLEAELDQLERELARVTRERDHCIETLRIISRIYREPEPATPRPRHLTAVR